MSRIRRFDHVGITVKDLDTVTAFFVGLGFETEGRMVLEGEFLDTVIGMTNSRTAMVMLRPPDGGTGWNWRSSSAPTTNRGRPTPWRTNWGCAAWRSKWTTFSRSSIGSPWTATTWLAASVSTRASGAWRRCADPRGSSCPWHSESTEK